MSNLVESVREDVEDWSSTWTRGCPDQAMVAVIGGKAKVLTYCGRYFEWETEDLRILVDDCAWDEPDGIYICEGGFVSDRDWETGIEQGGWEPGDVRPITAEEWSQYCTEDEPWPPEYYAGPEPEPPPTKAGPLPAECLVDDMDDYRWMQGPGCAAQCSSTY